MDRVVLLRRTIPLITKAKTSGSGGEQAIRAQMLGDKVKWLEICIQAHFGATGLGGWIFLTTLSNSVVVVKGTTHTPFEKIIPLIPNISCLKYSNNK